LDNKPPWLKKKIHLDNKNISAIKKLIDSSCLHTVCQSAKCPNIFECFSKRTATFMLMGDTCTRNCGFCGVNGGRPLPLDTGEPKKIAAAIKEMGLLYAVVTSVTRDDLHDGGASHFAETVKAIKNLNPNTRVECLIPDFGGNKKDLETLLLEELDVLNHNIETIESNYSKVRSKADYKRSLKLLKRAKTIRPEINTKSGFMVGLGENWGQIINLLEDLKDNKVDIITIGQYLSPSEKNIAVSKYYTPEEYEEIEKAARKLRFKAVTAGPFVRSSYKAEIILDEALEILK
jgi:lipoyl synthase